jgi:hypothetical protein
MDKKKFVKLAMAGLIVGRAIPAVPAPNDVASDVDAALQQARSEQQLSIQDIDALSGFDGQDDTFGLY